MEHTIFELANKCLEISQDKIIIRRNKIPYKNLILTDYDLFGEKEMYLQSLSNLIIAIAPKYPDTAHELQEHVNSYHGGDIIIHHSSIIAILKFIIALEGPSIRPNERKVFISHSSKDVLIVKSFCKLVLELGIGIGADDIFCTSIESMTMKNGEDIRLHIKNNILCTDFSFLMISDNYKSSEICLNEMGAVWAACTKVRCFLLPNVTFDKIGWLIEPNKAEKLTDPVALDSLQKEMISFYGLRDKGITWSENRTDFLSSLTNI